MKRKRNRIMLMPYVFLPIAVVIAITPFACQVRVSANNRSVKLLWEEHLAENTNDHCACDQERPNDAIAAQLIRYSTDDITTMSQTPGGRMYPINKAYGYLNGDGTTVITAQFVYTTKFAEGLAVTRGSGRFVDQATGYIDSSGQWIIPPSFINAYNFTCGRGRYFIQSNAGRLIYGYVKHDGTKIAGPLYEYATDFHCGVAMVGVERLWSRLLMRGYFIEEIGGELGIYRSYIYKLIDVDGNIL